MIDDCRAPLLEVARLSDDLSVSCDATAVRVGLILWSELDTATSPHVLIDDLVRLLAESPSTWEVTADPFVRLVHFARRAGPSPYPSISIAQTNFPYHVYPWAAKLAVNRFQTAERLGEAFIAHRQHFAQHPRRVSWLRLAIHLDRLTVTRQGLAFWLNVDTAGVEQVLLHGPSELPWDWNCGTEIIVIHTYQDSDACELAHPDLYEIPGAETIRFISMLTGTETTV